MKPDEPICPDVTAAIEEDVASRAAIHPANLPAPRPSVSEVLAMFEKLSTAEQHTFIRALVNRQ